MCEVNWDRQIAVVKRVDWRKMDDLREELGIETCLMGRFCEEYNEVGEVCGKNEQRRRSSDMSTRRRERR